MSSKKEKRILKYGSLNNAAVRLFADRAWYRLKKNGDIEMLVKVGITSRIRVRLIE